MALFGKKDQHYLGVDIGSHGIKLVELRKNKGRPQLWTYAVVDERLDIHPEKQGEKTPEDLLKEKQIVDEYQTQRKKKKKGEDKKNIPQALNDPRIQNYAKLLKTALTQSKATATNVTASLPVSEVFHTVLTVPAGEEKKYPAIIKSEIAKFISRPIVEMQIMHQVLPHEQKRYARVIATAAPKFVIAFYSAIFQAAGVQLKELETEAFALERSLVGRDKTTVAIVDIGAERTNFFIMDQGYPMTHRSIQLGGDSITKTIHEILGIEEASAHQIKKDLSKLSHRKLNAELFSPILNPIIKEIQYSMDVFSHQQGGQAKRPEKIILTGGSSVIPFFAEKLSETFQIRSFVGDPWARIVYQQGLKRMLDALGPRMGVSIGLALRNVIQ